MSDLKQLDETYVAGTYARFPVALVRGEGSLVYDEDGKRYIDMGSGIGVTAFGIADQQWQQAVTEQLGVLQHTSNLYYTQPCVLLAQQLCQKTGMKKVFFSNSGAEANECAIKTARKYACDKKGPEYYTIVTLENSFHGRTITTLAATGQAFSVFFDSYPMNILVINPGSTTTKFAVYNDEQPLFCPGILLDEQVFQFHGVSPFCGPA